MEVTLLNRQRGLTIQKTGLVAFLECLVETAPPGPADTMAIKLVSDRKMREYNRTYRGTDHATDVLSFPGDASSNPEGQRHLGDIVISVTTAARQAQQRRHSLDHELKILTLHGYLHLLGHDHEVDDGTMMRLQRRLARQLLSSGGSRSTG